MAAAPTAQLIERQDRNERYLSWIHAFVEEIPLTAQEWPGLPGGERAGFASEWDNYMGMAQTLIADYWSGELPTEQRDQLFALLRRIEQFAPLLHQMDLSGPDSRGLEVLLRVDATAT
ncbi:MAG: hypothetical protein U0232_19625 [Thermomicrobiales bacterium]